MRTLSEEDVDKCVAMYITGESTITIRKFFKAQFETIAQALSSRGIKTRKRKTDLNIEYFKEINSPEKAYWLGYIAADGCVHRHGWKVSIGSKDADILHKFQKAIGATSPVRYRETFDHRTKKTYGAYSIQICSKQFADFVRAQGIDENKSKNFQFPTHLPKDLWVHFIRGMFDGDGGLMVRFKNKNNSYSGTNINIVSTLEGAIFLRNFVKNELGFTVKSLRSTPEQGIHYFEMTKDSIKFLEWIYECSEEHMRLDRKYNKYLDCKKFHEGRLPIKFILESPQHEIFETHSLSDFCKKHDLRETALLVAFKKGRPTIRGKCVGWKILSKK